MAVTGAGKSIVIDSIGMAVGAKVSKDIIRKGIYAIIFIAMLVAFIYLGNKYAGNSEVKVLTINDYYEEIKTDNFQVINGTKFIKLFDEGKHIIVIGNSKSQYSQKYITEVNKIVEELNRVNGKNVFVNASIENIQEDIEIDDLYIHKNVIYPTK